jgi:putative hydrolase of HD superfamily
LRTKDREADDPARGAGGADDPEGRIEAAEARMIPREFVEDMLRLKRFPRTGWLRVGVRAPESIADHSFAAALLGWRIAREVGGLDATRVTLLLLVHDLAEARLGDIMAPAKKLFPDAAIEDVEREIVRAQWADDAEGAALALEFLDGTSAEAELARAVDNLEFLFEAASLVRSGRTGPREMLSRARQGLAWRHASTRPYVDEILRDLPAG